MHICTYIVCRIHNLPTLLDSIRRGSLDTKRIFLTRIIQKIKTGTTVWWIKISNSISPESSVRNFPTKTAIVIHEPISYKQLQRQLKTAAFGAALFEKKNAAKKRSKAEL